jgi:predicted XRE-type DNA-binding protein
MNIELSSGNVYADIGVSDAEEMLLKAQLASRIADLIQDKGLTQTQAAVMLGISQCKLSLMLRGQFRGLSEAKMLDCLARLGRDIQIVIGPECAGTGQIMVV